MRLIDIINGPWAITPEMLREITNIYMVHLRGEKIDIKAIEAKLGQPLDNQAADYEVRNGTAIIPVDGVIAKRMNWFSKISGGTSSELIAQDFKAALDDGSVEKILLLIDSPGGTVDGIETLSGLIYGSRGKKPISALSDGQMASAAYWLGSAVDSGQVFISGDTSVVGSIGVIATHVDKSKLEEKMGIKTTEITAGRYKRIASELAPLTKEGQAYLQDKVDYLYSIFVDTVAKHRGISSEKALAMADGNVFIGKQAVGMGLVDGIKSLDEVLSRPLAVAMGGFTMNSGGVPDNEKEEVMNKEDIKTKYPEAYNQIFAEGAAKGAQDMMPAADCEKKKAAGAEEQMGRIKAVYELGKKAPGHQALIEGLMFDGKTTGPEAALAIVEAESGKRAQHLADFNADGKNVRVPAADGAATDAAEAKEKIKGAKAEDKTLPVEERAKAAWDADAEVRSEFGTYETYLAWFRANDAGLVKTIGKK